MITAGTPRAGEGPLACESCLENLEATLKHLRQSYQAILVDSPPVIPYIDAQIIAPMTDGVVMVVESSVTREEVLDAALAKLKGTGCEVTGIVLNKRELRIPKWLYRFL